MGKTRLKILLIDSDENDFIVTRALLEEIDRDHFELHWVATYQEGVAAFQKCEYDVYLAEYRLGKKTGIDLLVAAQRHYCNSPIILLTGQGDREIDLAAMRCGAADYLVKGKIDAPLLERSIRYALERKRVEEALRQSEERFRGAFEYSTIGVAMVSLEGRFLRVNPAFCEMLGYTAEELGGMDFQGITYPEDLPHSLDFRRKMVEGELTHFHSEKRYLRKDGKKIWVLISVSVALGDDGKPSFFISHFNNITEKKNGEQALIESENRLRSIFEAEPECVKLIGEGGKLLDINPAGIAMLEADSVEQLRGRTLGPLISEGHFPAYQEMLAAVFEGHAKVAEFEIVSLKGNKRWVETHAVPLRNAENQIIALLGVSRDVTEKKNADRRLASERNLLRTLIDNIQDVRDRNRD